MRRLVIFLVLFSVVCAVPAVVPRSEGVPCLQLSGLAYASGKEKFGDVYYTAEKLIWSGHYRAAIEEIVKASKGIDDPALLEYGVFLLTEALRYPEFEREGASACDGLMTENRAFKEHEGLAARIGMLRARLSLMTGDTSAAEKALEKLSYIKEFRMIGPFSEKTADDFETAGLKQGTHRGQVVHAGKLYPVRWRSAGTNRLGVFDPVEGGLDTSEARYFLEAEFTTRKAVTREFHFGKTGHTRIWLDGRLIFESGTRHGFVHDQYRVRVECGPGRHRLLVRLGDSLRDGIKFSVRHRATEEKAEEAQFFEALERMESRARGGGPDDRYRAGFLFYASGLNSEEGGEAAARFETAMGSDGYGRMARYYLALCRDDEEKRLGLLREAAEGDGTALLPIANIVRSRLDSGFIYEVPPLIESIKGMNPSCPVGLELEALYFLARGWHEEALKRALALEDLGFNSAAASVRGRVPAHKGLYSKAAIEYERLWRMDRFNREAAKAFVESLELSGEPAAAMAILEECAHIFDCDAWFRRRLAGLVATVRGWEAALPYLSSALCMAPDNGGILFDLGSLYHRKGNSGLGLRYMKEALDHNPDDYRTGEYIEAIEQTSDGLGPYRVELSDALVERAEEYRAEGAVIILNEYVIKIMADGSFEKEVRKVFRINAESAISDFSTQYIVFNPDTDSVDKLRCVVTNGGETVESSEAYTSSLSDPESRLYYDLQARSLTIPSLRRGSLVDVSYRLRSGEARLYRGYTGERIMAGGRYRTLVSNIVVSRPEGMPLHLWPSLFDKKKISVKRDGGRLVHHLRLEDLGPVQNEVAMPHHSEIIPSLVVGPHGSWDEAAAWCASLMAGRSKMSAEMRRDLARLISEEDSDIEKTRKIYNHVSSSIRYVGFEFGLGGFQPRRADLTYATRMGDCKDMSLVLVSMLRAAGIDAEPALMRTQERGALNLSIPYVGQFNHAICYVNIEGGIFLDATVKMAGFRELPFYDRNIPALIVSERGHSFVNTGGKFYHDDKEVVITEVSIDRDGGAVFKRELTKGGVFAASIRRELVDKQNKLTDIASYWNSKYSGAGVNGFSALKTGTEEAVVYSYDGRLPSLLSTEGEYGAFPAFLVSNDYYREYGLMKKRNYPVCISYGWTSDTVVRFKIPKGWSFVGLPASEEREYPNFSARFDYVKKDDSTVEARSRIVFKESRVAPEEYKKFREFLIFIYRKENERIVVRNSEGLEVGDAR